MGIGEMVGLETLDIDDAAGVAIAVQQRHSNLAAYIIKESVVVRVGIYIARDIRLPGRRDMGGNPTAGLPAAPAIARAFIYFQTHGPQLGGPDEARRRNERQFASFVVRD